MGQINSISHFPWSRNTLDVQGSTGQPCEVGYGWMFKHEVRDNRGKHPERIETLAEEQCCLFLSSFKTVDVQTTQLANSYQVFSPLNYITLHSTLLST